MPYLPKNEWLPYAPDEPGSVRINHNSPTCSGSSKSLKITRTEDDRIFAKCYRCGGFASTAGRLSSVPAVAKRLAGRFGKTSRPITLPSDFTNEISRMPAVVRSKVYKYGIRQSDFNTFNIGWSEDMQRVVIPVYRDSDLAGWQARYYGSDVTFPKYITSYKDSGDLWIGISDPAMGNLPLVIVEDMFSAIRVSKYCPTLAMLGTELSDSALAWTSGFDQALVWTDYDSPGVRKKGLKVKDRLTMVGVDAMIRLSGEAKDPKEYTDTEILDTLKEYLDI